MIKALIFDMYETLVSLMGMGKEYYGSARMAEDACIPVKDFQKVWWESEEARSVGKHSTQDALAETLRAFGRYSDELFERMMKKRLAAHHAAFANGYIHPEIFPMLDALKERGCKIALISNCYKEEADEIRESRFFPYLDVAMLSNEQGCRKPGKEIYERCLKELGLSAGECLYVGDGGAHELETAGELGMHPVQATWYITEKEDQPCRRMPGFVCAETPMEVLRCVEEGELIGYASWYPEVPEGDFVSRQPTYEPGKYFPLFHEGEFRHGEQSMKYYWYDPREHGRQDSGKMPLLTFLHGKSNSLVGELCINYTGAEFYASEKYQKTLGGAYLLVPIANEYRDEDGVQGTWSDEYCEILHALQEEFVRTHTEGVGLRVLYGNSAGASMTFRMMARFMDDIDVAIPVGSSAFPEDAVLEEFDAKGKHLFLAIGKRDEFNSYAEYVEPKLPLLQKMKGCFIFTPEWVYNGDHGIASIYVGVEMGQHCLVNAMHVDLMFDDGTPMEESLPEGVTGWLRSLYG
ncbi:MAG: HAD-IA family hydrolase [Lachnospiraceae bacterium]|nr:HAD-IA family hydrolase [Lachnospiraceae bacterium]